METVIQFSCFYHGLILALLLLLKMLTALFTNPQIFISQFDVTNVN